MRFLDAMVCVCLALAIHKTDSAVRDTAKRCAKKMTPRDRIYMRQIIASPKPALHVRTFLMTVPDEILQLGSDEPGKAVVPFKKTFT